MFYCYAGLPLHEHLDSPRSVDRGAGGYRERNFLAQYDANILQSTSTPTVPSPQINLRAFNSIINYQGMDHISDDDLERFHLGKIMDHAELAIIEEHLLWCARCLDAAIEAAQYVDAMRVALIGGKFRFGVTCSSKSLSMQIDAALSVPVRLLGVRRL